MTPSTVLFFLGSVAQSDLVNHIGFTLYRQLRDDAPNLLVSPSSASILVGMLLAATGDSQELRRSLGLAGTKNLTQQLCRIRHDLQLRDNMVLLNRLYLQGGDYEVLQSFVDTLHDCFLADIRLVDFTKPRDERWAATKGHASTWLGPGTNLLFLDAVYLRSRWTVPFSSAGHRPFNGGRAVPTMQVTAQLPIEHDQELGAVIVGIPCESGMTMYIVLPDVKTPLEHVEDRLFKRDFRGLRNRTVHLFVPEFKVNASSDMGEALWRLGAHKLFSANFKGISSAAGLVGPAIMQTASLEVRRYGTTLYLTSIRGRLLTKSVKVDRPFLFVLRDNQLGVIHFIGRISRL